MNPFPSATSKKPHAAMHFVAAALLIFAAAPALADDHDADDFNFGLHASEKANVGQIGLPFYPGASRRHDKDGDSPAANLGFSAGSFGIKLVVIKYRSDDPAKKVLEFYREALSQYGPVLDCSGTGVTLHAHDDPVTCDDDDAKPGQVTLKVGHDSDQRAVSVRSVNGETQFDMLRLRLKGN